MSNPSVSRRDTAEAETFPVRLGPLSGVLKQADGRIFLPLIAVALWALSHPFMGVIGDGAVYIARALADLDPNGLGRDMMFVNDGQSRFSLFPLALDHLVSGIGVEATAILLAVVSMFAWLAALSIFARRYVAWHWVAVVVIFLAVLPPSYGMPWRFRFSEVMSVPRPFAEACVLAALTAVAGGRIWLAFLALIIASLVHPLMALAGWAVLGFVLCSENRRWRLAAALTVGALLVGAALGAPLLGRLFTVMSPNLKALATSRSDLLFPTQWPLEAIGPLVVQTASILVAASFYAGRLRVILLAAVVAGLGGIGAQILFGDFLSSLLVIQAQLWRMAWLLAALGNFALALCAIMLLQRGPRAHLVLALLAAAWLLREDPAGTAAIAAIALCLHFGTSLIRVPIPWAAAWIGWAALAILAVCLNLHYFAGYSQFLAGIPAGGPPGFGFFWNRRYVALPIGALALAFAFARPSRALWAAQCAVSLLLIGLVALCWDCRAPFQKLIDADRPPPALTRLLASRDGEVLWIGGLTEAWYLAGRPQWASPQQGVSTVFSPELAIKWRERMNFLIAHDLVHGVSDVVPPSNSLPHLTATNVAELCARRDAPAWIVAPADEVSNLQPSYWQPSVPSFLMTEEPDGSYAWHRIADYAVLPCAGGVTAARR